MWDVTLRCQRRCEFSRNRNFKTHHVLGLFHFEGMQNGADGNEEGVFCHVSSRADSENSKAPDEKLRFTLLDKGLPSPEPKSREEVLPISLEKSLRSKFVCLGSEIVLITKHMPS